MRRKLYTPRALAAQLENHRRRRQRIVFTNGVYDLLHAGHVTLLQKAKALGHVLVVGLNSDESVRRLKGPKRPIALAADRVRVLAALEPVDYLVFFEEDTPYELIRRLRPDILVKGGDYAAGQIVGRDLVKKVVRIPLVEGRSSTEIIRRIVTAYGQDAREGDRPGIEGTGELIEAYRRTWRLLHLYDEDRLPESPAAPVPATEPFLLDQVRGAVAELRARLEERGEASSLFGQERGEQLAGILGSLEQTFGGDALYPTVQQRAAHALYFIIKDHPFSDGNKRLASLLFLDFLRRQRLFLRPDGTPRLSPQAMVALVLLIAESKPADKDLMTRLIIGLLDDETAYAR